MFGKGLILGLKITFKKFFEKKITESYPEVKPQLPPRSRGSFSFNAEKCISCNLCANACPNSVIKVDFVKHEKGKKILQDYKMNLAYCLFCGLCVEACPTSALNFNTDFELACFKRQGTVYTWSNNSALEQVAISDSDAGETFNK